MKARVFTAVAAFALVSVPGSVCAGGSHPSAWVSGSGVNATTCGSTSSPCRTFQYAYNNVVAPGGSIYVRDAADYSPIKISHAISIINDSGGTATIVAVSGDAIDVQAAGSTVHLKGLTLDGVGLGANGVNFTSGASLTIENCTIKGFAGNAFTGDGILFHPVAGTPLLTVTDSVLSGNANAGVAVLVPSTGVATPHVSSTLTRVDAVNNLFGVEVGGATNDLVTLNATEVNVSGNYYGFTVVSGGALYLSRSTATGNNYGVLIDSAKAYSYGDNAINGNIGTDVAGALTRATSR